MNSSALPAPKLLDATVERTLLRWEAELTQPRWRGTHVQGWLFEGVAERRAAEQRLAAAGVHARLRCAYKPLVHYFLEEVQREHVVHALVRCPPPVAGAPRRFQAEAYPLAALLREGALQWDTGGDSDGPWYEVTLTMEDGSVHHRRVFVPLRAHADAIGALQHSPTGWLRVGRSTGARDLRDEAVATDYEALFTHVIDAVRRHPWPAQEPYFERLDIRIDLHGFEQALPGLDEAMSSYEALHEDVYFSLLEMFQHHSGRATGDRRLQPGQIVPDIRAAANGATPAVHMELCPFDTAAQDARAWADTTAGQPFEAMGMAPPPERVAAALAPWPGERFGATSRQGRTVHGLYHAGSDVPVFISGGQHANETSGVVGAVRAAQALLADRPGAHFALLPLENPDGYALHRELGSHHPRHMHHAARYSALGDDIAYREAAPLYERAARDQALALSGAQLHINLHGYPAHEWTRPLSGYVPRGFEQWMLPKGFFLILRCHAGWQERGRALLQSVTAALRNVPGLADYNARQMALYAQHAGPIPFEVLHGTACMVSQATDGAPVTLITEFPDETIDGDAFRFAHTVQMATVLAAQQAWQDLAAGPRPPVDLAVRP